MFIKDLQNGTTFNKARILASLTEDQVMKIIVITVTILTNVYYYNNFKNVQITYNVASSHVTCTLYSSPWVI